VGPFPPRPVGTRRVRSFLLPLQEDSDRCIALGADSFFTKPVSLDGLRDMLKVMIARWGHIYNNLRA
jgi:hypothetical protein